MRKGGSIIAEGGLSMASKGIMVEPVTDVMAEDYRIYDYGYLTFMSEVVLVKMEEHGGDIDWQELIEARFFNENQELYLWRAGDSLFGRRLTETGDIDAVETAVPVMKKFCPAGGKLVIRKYIDYDEDGQAFVANTRIKKVCQEVG